MRATRLLLIVALLAIASATAATADPASFAGPNISARYIMHLRAHVNGMRARRCLPRYAVGWRAVKIQPGLRPWVVKLWMVRHARVHQLRSRCLTRPTHYLGWLCIHGREGAWNANTGNGFYGGLQMTRGWMGLVDRADLLSPMQQMRAAELGYRNSGYSSSWMAGQWPNTYPPCASLFE